MSAIAKLICRIFGHVWVDTQTVQGNDVDIVYMECDRCGAETSRMRG